MASSKKFDVFLSFRGEDTRYGIAGHIYRALDRKKIKTYIDDECLERCDEITPALLSAIEGSRISVVIFSKDYASSSWCLSELVHIQKCRRELDLVVLPIFFEVDPSHVRNPDQGSYRDSFKRHEDNPKHDAKTINDWRSALKSSADLSGLHYSRSNCLAKFRTESALIEDVVNTVLKTLNEPAIPVELHTFEGLMGMEKHFRMIKSLLMSASQGLQIIGIYGMAGVGKTTIAEVVWSQLYTEFESHYFLKDVRESSEKYGLARLRNELITRLLEDEKLIFGSLLPRLIPSHVKDRLRRTKVLLVLDDVSEKKQLEYLIGDHIGNGSRVIVTTRDEAVLRGTDIKGATFNKYKVDVLSLKDALVLFRSNTDSENPLPEDYGKDVVEYVGRNPLAIKVFGSHLRSLRNPCIENWKMELDKLKEIPHDDILEKLKVSYDALDKTEQKIFLDIACFFKGMQREFVQSILNKCDFHGTTGREGLGLFANIGIDSLIDKSLITLDGKTNSLDMHDLMQQMGWDIVRRESEEPGNRSRLWKSQHVYHVFDNDTGSARIEGIFLNASSFKERLRLKPRLFQRMKNLRLLIIYSHPIYRLSNMKVEALECFPESLRYLKWEKYPLKSLPTGFSAHYLVKLELIGSQLETLWDGTQEVVNLKIIDLTGSIYLNHLPDLSLAPNLEAIILKTCYRLAEFPWGVLGKLKRLSNLDLSNCRELCGFPECINAKALKTLQLGGCRNLVNVPCIASATLVTLKLSSIMIADLPSTIRYPNNFNKVKAILYNCDNLVSLPRSISQLHFLETLDLRCCTSLEEFPELPKNIVQLLMDDSALKEVPSSLIEGRSRLRKISLAGCSKLESLPESIFDLVSLVVLDLSNCFALMELPEIRKTNTNLKTFFLNRTGIKCLPSSFKNLTNLKCLDVRSCLNIQRISELPLTLTWLHAEWCQSLEEVVLVSPRQELSETARKTFRRTTLDFADFSRCLRLNQCSQDNIITAFQRNVLHMASHYYAASKCEVKRPPVVTVVLPGSKIPNWFEFRCKDFENKSSSVMVPLLHDEGIMGFALCTVHQSKNWKTDGKCKIEFKGKDEACLESETTTINFEYNGSTWMKDPSLGHVVMWYKYFDYRHLRGRAVEASFTFSVVNPTLFASDFVPIKCGVHCLRAKDLKDLDLIDEDEIDKLSDANPLESSRLTPNSSGESSGKIVSSL